MRHRQKLSFEDLQEEAHDALKSSEYTQEEMASELGVTRVSVAKAVTQAGPKFQNLQTEILEELTPYELHREEKVRFRVQRQDRDS